MYFGSAEAAPPVSDEWITFIPLNPNYSLITALPINFTFIPRSSQLYLNCSLYVNGSMTNTCIQILNDTQVSWYLDLGNGSYAYNYSCDIEGYSNSTDEQELNVSVAYPYTPPATSCNISSDKQLYATNEDVIVRIDSAGSGNAYVSDFGGTQYFNLSVPDGISYYRINLASENSYIIRYNCTTEIYSTFKVVKPFDWLLIFVLIIIIGIAIFFKIML